MRPPRSAQDPGPSTRPPTPYETRLYSLCSAIPPGKVSTYGALAEVLRSSPRAVGQVRPVPARRAPAARPSAAAARHLTVARHLTAACYTRAVGAPPQPVCAQGALPPSDCRVAGAGRLLRQLGASLRQRATQAGAAVEGGSGV